MLTFPTELQDILGFKICKGAGHIFAWDPKEEMNRHYSTSSQEDPYLSVRDTLHDTRVGSSARQNLVMLMKGKTSGSNLISRSTK